MQVLFLPYRIGRRRQHVELSRLELGNRAATILNVSELPKVGDIGLAGELLR